MTEYLCTSLIKQNIIPMSKLFSPIRIKEIELRNRIVISPMDQYSSTDGFATDWHLVHLGSRAVGGASLIIQEASAVSPEGRITPGDLGIYRDEHIEKLKQITGFIHSQGAVAGIQLAHAGRKASCEVPWRGGKQIPVEEGGWIPVAPSPVSFNQGEQIPLDLDSRGIEKVKNDFRVAALRALDAGYRVVEIHAAHGYLLHEFLSPLSNHRTDQYGGSFENKSRLLVEVVKTVQTVWPSNLPLFVRISATDWAEDGWDIDEAVKLSLRLKETGVDLIDCSSGGLVPYQKIRLGPGYQVPFSERIRQEAGIMTGTVGLITESHQAEEILRNQQADLILIGRESLRNPYVPLTAAKELGVEIPWPLQYLRAK